MPPGIYSHRKYGKQSAEWVAKRALARTEHGHCPKAGPSSEYNSWRGMKRRCLNPHATNYSFYGGRGISVCNRWLKFENFLTDMGRRPAGMTLDRIDNAKNYEPSNCRWAVPVKQASNRRRQRRHHIGPLLKDGRFICREKR